MKNYFMQQIVPKNRQQMEFVCLEDLIESNNALRFVDALVEKVELDKLWNAPPHVFDRIKTLQR